MTETVNDYVNIEENEVKEEKLKSKPKRNKKQKSNTHVEEDVGESETSRKRDILASVAMTVGLEEYLGEDISAVDIRKMNDSKLESLFKVYEETSGQELMKDGMTMAVDGIVKVLSYMLTFDDEESLKKDLLNNKQLGRRIGKYASKVSEEYGDVVAFLKVGLDIAKHVVFTKDEVETIVEDAKEEK